MSGDTIHQVWSRMPNSGGGGAGVRIHAKPPEWHPSLGQCFLEVRPPSEGNYLLKSINEGKRPPFLLEPPGVPGLGRDEQCSGNLEAQGGACPRPEPVGRDGEQKQPGETNPQTNLQTRAAFVMKEKGPIQLQALGARCFLQARAPHSAHSSPGAWLPQSHL